MIYQREFSYDLRFKLSWDTPEELYEAIAASLSGMYENELASLLKHPFFILPFLIGFSEEDLEGMDAAEYFYESISDEIYTEEEFFEFCRLYQQPETIPPTKEVLIMFERYGMMLEFAWIKLDDNVNNVRSAYSKIVDFARSHEIRVLTLNHGVIDLETPGDLPAGYFEALTCYLKNDAKYISVRDKYKNLTPEIVATQQDIQDVISSLGINKLD